MTYASGCKTSTLLERDFKATALELTQEDRIMVLAPHPDDEVLGAAGIIQRATKSGLPLKIVFLTCGDNNQLAFMLYRKHPVLAPSSVRKMGEIRLNEAVAAGKVMGVKADEIVCLGYPDFGTLHMFLEYWDTNAIPFRSMLTRSREVFYDKAFRKGAPYRAVDVMDDIKHIIKDFQPTLLFTSHPSDLNPDHQALYAFSRIVLMELKGEGAISNDVKFLPYLVHFKKWPNPKSLDASTDTLPPMQLGKVCEWKVFTLTEEEISNKRISLKAHKTQYAYSANFMDSFVRKTEIFGDFLPIKIIEGSDLLVSSDSSLDEPPPAIANEQDKFIDIGSCFVRKEGDYLIFTIFFKKPIVKEGSAYLNCFGYSKRKSFALMPKIRVRVGMLKYEVFNGNKRLDNTTIELVRRNGNIYIKMPVAIMSNAEKLLVSASSYLEELSLDWTGWRIVDVSD